ncbi:MAG TPA: DUF3618 domain-containing protein [Actinocrinis sp.]|nr:DUF3618 domain-containing protein [Actinocrinis sp.]
MTQDTTNEKKSTAPTTAKPDLKAVPTPAAAVEPETKDPEVLREQVAQTREDLGDTVAALAAKADVKQRTKTKLAETRVQAQETYAKVAEKTREHTPQPVQNAAEKAASATEGKRTKIAAGLSVALAALLTTLKLRKRNS